MKNEIQEKIREILEAGLLEECFNHTITTKDLLREVASIVPLSKKDETEIKKTINDYKYNHWYKNEQDEQYIISLCCREIIEYVFETKLNFINSI